ncbi:MAG: ribonuclease PH [Proteobacteria bacterium]|nr:ribonuclease PH [Pseudomonadota bacterium]
MRSDGRANDALRTLKITPDYLEFAHGSCLIEIGSTRVLCTAMIEESVPRWMQHKGQGWVTAEYSMLPGSTPTRTRRGVTRGKADGRTVEIQRLIGRSIRSVADFKAMGKRTIWLDCDVLQADGGTRCASITGAWVAFALAGQRLIDEGEIKKIPVKDTVSAISVGVFAGMNVLDLPYKEDSKAEVDMNIVCTGDGRYVEVQGTAEGEPFDRAVLDALLELGSKGCGELREAQLAALEATGRVKTESLR